jgi:uncharacterized protein
MTEVTSHSPGSFSWTDLSTPDQAASKAFYTTVFGWDSVDNDIGEGMVYSQMQLRGKPVAAIASSSPDQAGAPAEWAVYVTVPSADAAAQRASELGGTVGGDGPFDVFEFGRMAFIADPRGASFRLWEPGSHIGAEIIREPGAVAWFELSSPDPEGVAKFYSALFDWTVAGAQGMEDYLIATTAAGEGTGAIQAASDGQPTGWIVYFWTDDVDATLATATEHGAEVLVPATDIPGGMGRFAILRDPQGATFALFRA